MSNLGKDEMAEPQIKRTDDGWPIAGDPDPEFVVDLINACREAACVMEALDAAADKAPGPAGELASSRMAIVRTNYALANRNVEALDTLRTLLARVGVS